VLIKYGKIRRTFEELENHDQNAFIRLGFNDVRVFATFMVDDMYGRSIAQMRRQKVAWELKSPAEKLPYIENDLRTRQWVERWVCDRFQYMENMRLLKEIQTRHALEMEEIQTRHDQEVEALSSRHEDELAAHRDRQNGNNDDNANEEEHVIDPPAVNNVVDAAVEIPVLAPVGPTHRCREREEDDAKGPLEDDVRRRRVS